MSDQERPPQPTHRAYTVITRQGKDDYWSNIGLVFPHKDDKGYNVVLQALPLDGKIVCREIGEEDGGQRGPARDDRKAPRPRVVK